MTFDLSLVSEPRQEQVLMQLVIKVPSLEYFRCVRYIKLYTKCSNSLEVQQEVAFHTILDEEMDNEWLEFTINYENCTWEQQGVVHFFLQLADEEHVPVAFTNETATDLKSFLIIYTHNLPLPFDIENLIKKRQTEQVLVNEIPKLVNRTTVSEIIESNMTCTKHEVFLTQNELRYRGNVVGPFPGAVKMTYCLGQCDYQLVLPSNNETIYDSRTRLLMNDINNNIRKPPPCCIPDGLTAVELLVQIDSEVCLFTFPQVIDCMCQL